MIELPGDSVYGGSFSQEQFMAAEFRVDKEVEAFKTEGVPYVDVVFNGLKRRLHPFNTSVIRYDVTDQTMHDHILHQTSPPEFLFYADLGGVAQQLANMLMEKDFPLLMHYSEPHPHVKEKLYEHMRGSEQLHDVLERITDGS